MRLKQIICAALILALCLCTCACGQTSTETASATPDEQTSDTQAASSEASASSSGATDGALGAFDVSSISGEQYTEEMFAQHELTLVNIMATWCGPCVNEMPELEKLYQANTDKGVAVVGIVWDAATDGVVDQSIVDTAKEIQEATGVTYPLLIPDANGFSGLLDTVQAFPTTYFIGKDGQSVAAPQVGAMDLENWQAAVDSILAALEQ